MQGDPKAFADAAGINFTFYGREYSTSAAAGVPSITSSRDELARSVTRARMVHVFKNDRDDRKAEAVPMADNPSREEMSARLEAVEARLETRLVGLDAKLDRIGDQMAAGFKVLTTKVESAEKSADQARDEAHEARKASSNVKWNIIFTALAVVAVLYAAWQMWAQGMDLVQGLLTAKSTLPPK